MTRTVSATFDGEALRLDEPIDLEPYTKVRVTIEMPDGAATKPKSFLDTAASLNLDGPSDWSARLEDYLYGRDHIADE